MLNRIIISRHVRSIILSGLFSVGIAIIFIIYLFTIGIPKTSARNLYNRAIRAKADSNYTMYAELIKAAYRAWPEGYIAAEIEANSDLYL